MLLAALQVFFLTMILFVCLLSLSDLELIRAQGARRRIEAITNACEIFDHYDEARHNIELYQGAAQALGKMLDHPQPDDALRMICSALEMVFRASTRTVQQSYGKCGSGPVHDQENCTVTTRRSSRDTIVAPDIFVSLGPIILLTSII